MVILGISGSLRADSHNGRLLRAAAAEVPDGVRFELWGGMRDVPPYDEDLDTAEPPVEVARLRDAIARADALLIATPEYNSSIPGCLKNAIDWASRPYGKNSFARKPSAVIGASPGLIGTAVAQQHLRSLLGYCNSPQMNAPEAYIHFTPGLIDAEARVTNDSTEAFLRKFMEELHAFVVRVYTVLPRNA